MKGRRWLKWVLPVGLVLMVVVGISVYDYFKNESYVKINSRPEESISSHIDEILYQFENDLPVNFEDFDTTFQYVDGRYDCSDFRLQSLIRILYKYEDQLDEATRIQIKDTLLNFKYWMDQPGEDSMCFWSENHQILFAVSEYLAGKKYPNELFINSGLTGAEHMVLAQSRIEAWMKQKWDYGFTEWYSNVYYVEDIAPMSNFIDFSGDETLSTKMSIIMDLLIYDMASQSYKGTFVTTSGRAYESGKKSGENASTRSVTEFLFGYDTDTELRQGMDLNFIYGDQYKTPEVLRLIGKDESATVIKASSGLNVSELKDEGLIGQKDHQIMMQWGMEAFTNADVITNSVNYIRNNEMLSNEFLNAFKDINYTVLLKLHLLPTVSNIINPQTNGVAIQRANTYTYKSPYYSMATAQAYHPGDYGDQQSINIVTFSNEFSTFHNHPAVEDDKKGPNGNSPLYWVGYGHLPHSVQEGDINLSIYILPDKKGMMEQALLNYTHAYMPKEKFDEVVLDGNYAFAKYGDSYLAYIGLSPMYYKEGTSDDLIQDGQSTYWVTELGNANEDGDFQTFMNQIKSNEITFNDRVLSYSSGERSYVLEYKGDFKVDGAVIDTDYDRFESPYSQTERKPSVIRFEFNGKDLELDFDNATRVFN